jgi:lipopolysaccharide transport system permease protein
MTTGTNGASVPAARSLPHVVIEPRSGAAQWWELWQYRNLLTMLVERDIRLRYRQTALGVVWVILQPLVASLIFTAVFGIFAKLPSNGSPYVLFVFAAMLAWNLFSGGVQRAGNSLVNDRNLITKIYFPRPILPIASVGAVLLDFAVAAAVMLGLMLLLGEPITLTVLAVLPLGLLAITATLGVSLLLSALNVYYRDFAYALPFILQIWLYASPVVYSSSLVPDRWRLVYALNPMVGVIDGFRWAFLGGEFPTLPIVAAVAASTIALVIGATVFMRVERTFADVI